MKIRLFALLFTLLAAGWVWAAENQVEQAEENAEATEEASVEAEAIDGVADQAIDETTAEEAAEELEDEESPGRFVPTEQISQDLGVSFPVDI